MHLSDATQNAHEHQRTFRIMITIAVTAHNIQLIIEMTITSYTGNRHSISHLK